MHKDSEKARKFFESLPGKRPKAINYKLLDEELFNKLPNEFRHCIKDDESNYGRYFGESFCGLYPDDRG